MTEGIRAFAEKDLLHVGGHFGIGEAFENGVISDFGGKGDLDSQTFKTLSSHFGSALEGETDQVNPSLSEGRECELTANDKQFAAAKMRSQRGKPEVAQLRVVGHNAVDARAGNASCLCMD